MAILWRCMKRKGYDISLREYKNILSDDVVLCRNN